MTVFKVRIDLEGDAFRPENGAEIARILRKVAKQIEARRHVNPMENRDVVDMNGNGCGFWLVVGDRLGREG